MFNEDVGKGRSPTPSRNHIEIEQCCKGAVERAALLHGFDPKVESKHEEEYRNGLIVIRSCDGT